MRGHAFWKKRSPIAAEDETWLIECWRWLDGVCGPIDGVPCRPLILPGRSFFPDTNAAGHARALHYFEQVRLYCGMAEWPCILVPQNERAPVTLGFAVEKSDAPRPAGTFQLSKGEVSITYDPNLLGHPLKLVATLVHELAHYRLAAANEAVPGGPDLVEPAMDLATVHLGFGLFGANAAFSFRQFTDFDRQGWSYSRLGYLPSDVWGYANALFFELLGIPENGYADYAKSDVATAIRKSRAYLAAHPAVIASLKEPARR